MLGGKPRCLLEVLDHVLSTFQVLLLFEHLVLLKYDIPDEVLIGVEIWLIEAVGLLVLRKQVTTSLSL